MFGLAYSAIVSGQSIAVSVSRRGPAHESDPDTKASPFVAEVLHDFFVRRSDWLFSFAMLGGQNLSLSYVSED
jgi:hypothetical protein